MERRVAWDPAEDAEYPEQSKNLFQSDMWRLASDDAKDDGEGGGRGEGGPRARPATAPGASEGHSSIRNAVLNREQTTNKSLSARGRGGAADRELANIQRAEEQLSGLRLRIGELKKIKAKSQRVDQDCSGATLIPGSWSAQSAEARMSGKTPSYARPTVNSMRAKAPPPSNPQHVREASLDRKIAAVRKRDRIRLTGWKKESDAVESELGRLLQHAEAEVARVRELSEGISERESVLEAYGSREFWQFALTHTRDIEGLLATSKAQEERGKELDRERDEVKYQVMRLEEDKSEIAGLRTAHSALFGMAGGGGEGDPDGLPGKIAKLKEREEGAARRAEEVAGMAEALDQREREVARRERHAEEGEAEARGLARELAAREQAVERREREAARAEASAVDRERRLRQREATVGGREAECEQREGELGRREGDMWQRAEAMQRVRAEVDAELRSWEEELSMREEALVGRGASPLLNRRLRARASP